MRSLCPSRSGPHRSAAGLPRRLAYRGSSALGTTFETIIALTPPSTGASEGNAAFTLKFSKVRASRGTWAASRSLKLGEGADGSAAWIAEEDGTEREDTLLRLVLSCEHDGDRALGRAMGIGHQAVDRLRTKMLAKGTITMKKWNACVQAAKGAARGVEEPEDPREAALGAGDF